MRAAPRISTLIWAVALLLLGAGLGTIALGSGSDERPRAGAAAGAADRAGQAPTPEANSSARARRGPRGKRGKRGKRGRAGVAGSNNERVRSLDVHWTGTTTSPVAIAATTTLPGIGTASVHCPQDRDFDTSKRVLRITPSQANRRTTATMTTFQGAGTSSVNADNQRFATTGAALTIPLPSNGMIDGVIAVEPFAGGTVEPGSLASALITLSSQWKTNDPASAENFCHISAQVIADEQR